MKRATREELQAALQKAYHILLADSTRDAWDGAESYDDVVELIEALLAKVPK